MNDNITEALLDAWKIKLENLKFGTDTSKIDVARIQGEYTSLRECFKDVAALHRIFKAAK